MPLIALDNILRAEDANGDSVSGALRYIYEAGTTTVASVFSDDGLTTPQANPLTADAGGLFDASYLADGSYKVMVKTPGDVTLWERDNVDVGVDLTLGVVRGYGTVPLLVADTVLSYTTGASNVLVGTGDYVTVSEGDYTYKVAASGATDHDLTTAGGVKLYVQANSDGSYSLDAFNPTGDGVTDDATALQAAIYAAAGSILHLGNKTYRTTKSLFSPQAVQIIGTGSPKSRILVAADTSTDGIVFGWRNVTAYANQAAFDAAVSGLDDGWYLIGSTTLAFAESGAQTASDTRDVSVFVTSNRGYVFEGVTVYGNSTTEVRDLVVCDNLWKVALIDVWARTAGGRGFAVQQCLHADFDGLRSDDTVGIGFDITSGTNTSTTVRSGYFRTTHNGAGIKSNCIGIHFNKVICEGIGGGSGSDVYAPGIWITGGSATITQPYFEDVRGHNIVCESGRVSITGGYNGSGAGADTALYASVLIQGDAHVSILGAGYDPGGGNKKGIKVSSALTGSLVGMADEEVVTLHADLADITNYTEADSDVANEAAVLALGSPSLNDTAHAQDTGMEYTYDGSAWVRHRSYDFPGAFLGKDRGSSDSVSWWFMGKDLRDRVGETNSVRRFRSHTVFSANASDDNVAALQSGAAIAANSAVSTTKTLTDAIPGYSGSTAKNFSVRFMPGAALGGALFAVAEINNATTVTIKVVNPTGGSLNLANDVKGAIVVERFTTDSD